MSGHRLLLLVLIGIDGVLCRYIISPWPDSKWPQGKKNFTKREATCPEDQYLAGAICCQLCPSGTKKTRDCTVNGGKPECKACTPGKDYTDLPHYQEECLRCGLCDGEHGLEVRKNCTTHQNVVCGCAKNFFCNTLECRHCDPCTQCTHGVLEECTEKRNAICQVQGNDLLYILLLIPLLLLLSGAIIAYYRYRGKNKNYSCTPKPSSPENVSLIDKDIDLSKYISKFAERMELDQVKRFVREMDMSEVLIDQIKNNHIFDTDEQKFQLLKRWYEAHGKRGAYGQLIMGLRRIGLLVVAGKLQEIVNADQEIGLENGNSSVPQNQGLASS